MDMNMRAIRDSLLDYDHCKFQSSLGVSEPVKATLIK
jgi:hypothetical protein